MNGAKLDSEATGVEVAKLVLNLDSSWPHAYIAKLVLCLDSCPEAGCECS